MVFSHTDSLFESSLGLFREMHELQVIYFILNYPFSQTHGLEVCCYEQTEDSILNIWPNYICQLQEFAKGSIRQSLPEQLPFKLRLNWVLTRWQCGKEVKVGCAGVVFQTNGTMCFRNLKREKSGPLQKEGKKPALWLCPALVRGLTSSIVEHAQLEPSTFQGSVFLRIAFSGEKGRRESQQVSGAFLE